ncbi:hypothetical protein FPOAC2_04264 [Fusarium poae]|uniref:hypothetical protein n=1 Tax=Fusarium poae TaxID=36050 RepID=UPI001CE74DAB|nr:hypothetical protein FPOAC1_004161 [Fusarium poae]KAG8670926.1 hypothetical protein FPOAC1_004161 [Fusarium poae]
MQPYSSRPTKPMLRFRDRELPNPSPEPRFSPDPEDIFPESLKQRKNEPSSNEETGSPDDDLSDDSISAPWYPPVRDEEAVSAETDETGDIESLSQVFPPRNSTQDLSRAFPKLRRSGIDSLATIRNKDTISKDNTAGSKSDMDSLLAKYSRKLIGPDLISDRTDRLQGTRQRARVSPPDDVDLGDYSSQGGSSRYTGRYPGYPERSRRDTWVPPYTHLSQPTTRNIKR